MVESRIKKHPILSIDETPNYITFTFNRQKLKAKVGEMISSALFAHGIHIFGHHNKDDSPQGMFCANGQCSQCLVIADGIPVKSCVTPVAEDIISSCFAFNCLPLNVKFTYLGICFTDRIGCFLILDPGIRYHLLLKLIKLYKHQIFQYQQSAKSLL